MAKFVIKRDGTKEPFDAGKIRAAITAAAREANISAEEMNKLVEQVSGAAIKLAEGKEKIATTEIEEKILSELDTIKPSVSETWRKHEQGKA